MVVEHVYPPEQETRTEVTRESDKERFNGSQ